MQKLSKVLSILILIFVLAGCKPDEKFIDDGIVPKNKVNVVDISDEIPYSRNILKVVENGIDGVFNPLYAISDADKTISFLQFLPIIFKNRDLTYTTNNSLAVDFKNINGNLRIRLRDIDWWDETPVTSEDVLFSLKILLDKNYTGVERSSLLFNIKGAWDFYNNKSDEISGFKILDEKSFLIALENPDIEMDPAFNFRPISKAYYGSVPFSEIRKLDDKPMGNGAYEIYNYEKLNFCNLRSKADFYYNTPAIKNIFIREETLSDKKSDLYNGEADIIDIYGNNEIRFDETIRDNYNMFTVYENNSTLLMNVPSGDLVDPTIRKFIFSIIDEEDFATERYKLLKYDVGIVSLSNRFYSKIELPYQDVNPNLNNIDGTLFINGKPFKITLLYSNVGLNDFVATRIEEKLKSVGISVNKAVRTPEEIKRDISAMREEMANVIYISNFKNGDVPDFGLLYTGSEFMGAPQENRFKMYVDSMEPMNYRKRIERYRRFSEDLIENAWVRGIGSPIARTYIRTNLRYVFNSENLSWYEGDVWNISIQ